MGILFEIRICLWSSNPKAWNKDESMNNWECGALCWDKLHAGVAMDMCLLVAKGITEFPVCAIRLTGTIDVYWIVQDGGLCILVSYLLKQSKVGIVLLLVKLITKLNHSIGVLCAWRGFRSDLSRSHFQWSCVVSGYLLLEGLAWLQVACHCDRPRNGQQHKNASRFAAIRLSASYWCKNSC